MECNKDEALRAKEIAEDKFMAKDYTGAKKLALKAQTLFPALESIDQMIITLDIYLASEIRVAGEKDWYKILSVHTSANDETLKKQCRKLLLQIHPDKNKSVGADGAFHIIKEAFTVLSNKAARALYDQKRNISVSQQTASHANTPNPAPGPANIFYDLAHAASKAKQTVRAATTVAPAPASTPPAHAPAPASTPLAHAPAPTSTPRLALAPPASASIPHSATPTSIHPAPAAPPTPHPKKPDSFWTACHKCSVKIEYLKVYLNCKLRCPSCREPFLAIEAPAPPVGAMPIQDSNNSANKNTSTDRNFQWGPFSRVAGILCAANRPNPVTDPVNTFYDMACAASKAWPHKQTVGAVATSASTPCPVPAPAPASTPCLAPASTPHPAPAPSPASTSRPATAPARASVSTPPPPPPPAPSTHHLEKPDSFWTTCNKCKVQCEYPRIYLNCNLSCPSCRRPFRAIETAAPPVGVMPVVQESSNSGPNQNVSTNITQLGEFSTAAGVVSTIASFAVAGHAANVVHQTYGKVKRERDEPQAVARRKEVLGKKYNPLKSANVYDNHNLGIGDGAPAKKMRVVGNDAGVVASSSAAAQDAKVVHQAYGKVSRGRKEAPAEAQREEALGRKYNPLKRGASVFDNHNIGIGDGTPAKKMRAVGNDAGAISSCFSKSGPNVTSSFPVGAGSMPQYTKAGPYNFGAIYARFRQARTSQPRINLAKAFSDLQRKVILRPKMKVILQEKVNELKTRPIQDGANQKASKKEKVKENDEQKETDASNAVSIQDVTLDLLENDFVNGMGDNDKLDEHLSYNVPDSDFHDFDMDRIESSFESGQVWATYDEEDGMPRCYIFIREVLSRTPFKLKISFLTSKTNSEFGSLNWVSSGFSKTCGFFRIGRCKTTDRLNIFSHRIKWEKGPRGVIKVFPQKGDVWAVYRNWSPDWNIHTPHDVLQVYYMVEVLDDYDEDQGISIIPLVKVAGFRAVFQCHPDKEFIKKIPKEEMFRFSHQVPFYKLLGEEAPKVPKDSYEVDPAATSKELLQVITEMEELKPIAD